MRTLRIAFGLMTTLPFKLPEDWSAGDSGPRRCVVSARGTGHRRADMAGMER